MDEVIFEFYEKIVGPYWDEERNYIDLEYRTIPFPFSEIELGEYKIEKKWSFEEMMGYFGSWSAVQHYITANQNNPVNWIEDKLKSLWPDSNKVKTTTDVIMRVGRKLED